jgi:hypothetical protein
MAEKKSTKAVTPNIDIDALVEKRINVNKEELRQQILEEQLGELLQSEAIQEANLHDFLEQLKGAGKELWTLASSMPVVEIARFLSGADLLEQKLKNKRKPRRPSVPREELDGHKKKLLMALKGFTEGQTIGQLAKNLPFDISLLKRLLVELRKDNLIVTQGEKRSTRYLPA